MERECLRYIFSEYQVYTANVGDEVISLKIHYVEKKTNNRKKKNGQKNENSPVSLHW